MRSLRRSSRPLVLLLALLPTGAGACRSRSPDRPDAQEAAAPADAAPAPADVVRRRIARAHVDAAPGSEDAGPGAAGLPPTRDGGGDAAPCPSSFGRYNRTQLDAIVRLRADGAGLVDVAKVVGGTREEVKAAEAAELARRKLRKALARRAGGDPCVE